jgi:hypothetical protein
MGRVFNFVKFSCDGLALIYCSRACPSPVRAQLQQMRWASRYDPQRRGPHFVTSPSSVSDSLSLSHTLSSILFVQGIGWTHPGKLRHRLPGSEALRETDARHADVIPVSGSAWVCNNP